MGAGKGAEKGQDLKSALWSHLYVTHISCPPTALFPNLPPDHALSHVVPQWQQFNDTNERNETHEVKEIPFCIQTRLKTTCL